MTPIAYRRWLLLVLLAVLATWALRSGRIVVPAAWNPWAPLDVDAPPNLLTRFKLSRASSDRVACRVALEQATMRFASLDDRVTGPGCGFDNALRIERTSVGVGEPFALSCRAALSLAMWERHVLQQAAVAQLGSRVVSLEHYGSYACRNVYDDPGRRRSRHATADAFDIAGFVLQDGRRIRVVNDWMPHAGEAIAAAAPTEGSMAAEARFLRAVRDGACRYFDAVLGPDYNRAHADHFHFDRGAARICR